MRVKATPLTHSAVLAASKRVSTPDLQDKADGLHTVYDKWKKSFPDEDNSKPKYLYIFLIICTERIR